LEEKEVRKEGSSLSLIFCCLHFAPEDPKHSTQNQQNYL
jgi:hypothetical protein